MIISARTSNIFGGLRLFCSYQKIKSTLSENAQIAVWASANIRKIINAERSDRITDPSLRQQLINLRHPADAISDQVQRQKILNNKDLIFDEEPRNKVLNIYKNGVKLSDNVFQQTRITRAADSGNFVFCPNLLVTQDIFKLLLNQKGSTLIYGGFGISKTVSFVLFTYLCSIVNKFISDTYNNEAEQQQAKFLVNIGLIFDVPKLFYWSLDSNNTQKLLQQSIMDQITELSQNQKKLLSKITNFTEFIRLVNDLYCDRKIKVRCIIDQVNILGQYFRKWNNFYVSCQPGTKQWIQKFEYCEDMRLKGEMLRTRMKQFQKLGRSTFYNSSIKIEQDLLAIQKQNSKYRTINIENDHEPIRKQSLKYIQNLDAKWGCIDFTHIFWFQIEKKLKTRKKLTDQKIQKFKTVFYQKLKDMKWPKYLRFLNIRRMLQKKTVQLQIVYSNLQSNTDIQRAAFKLINLLLKSSAQDYQRNLQNFIIDQKIEQVASLT